MSRRLFILKNQQIWKLIKQILKALQKILTWFNLSSLINLQNSHNENVNNFRKLFYEKVSPGFTNRKQNPK